MPGGRNVEWFEETAESFEPVFPYTLAVAAESVYWMNGSVCCRSSRGHCSPAEHSP